MSPIRVFRARKIIELFRDLEHDLFEEERILLSYGMKNNFFSPVEMEVLENILRELGDDKEYYNNMYYNGNLLEEKLNELLDID